MTDRNIKDIRDKIEKDIVSDTEIMSLISKIERISSATYLVTFHIKDNIKDRLQDIASELLSVTVQELALPNKDSIGFEIWTSLKTIQSFLTELLLHIKTANSGRLVSDSNYLILSREIEFTIEKIKEYIIKIAKTENSPAIASDFFAKSDMGSIEKLFEKDKFIKDSYAQGQVQQDIQSHIGHGLSIKDIRNRPKNQQNQQSHSIQEDRRKRIIEIIKDKKTVQVSDVSKVVSECSEKTVQRLLLSMVDEGVLRKDGEKRWSRYSLM